MWILHGRSVRSTWPAELIFQRNGKVDEPVSGLSFDVRLALSLLPLSLSLFDYYIPFSISYFPSKMLFRVVETVHPFRSIYKRP